MIKLALVVMGLLIVVLVGIVAFLLYWLLAIADIVGAAMRKRLW